MVKISLRYWKELELLTRQNLYTPTELFVLGNKHDNFVEPSYHVLSELGLPIQYLSPGASHERFPQFSLASYDQFTYNTEAGILHASKCLHVLKELVQEMGGNICESQHVTQIRSDSSRLPITLHTSNGDEIVADRVVLALGPWVHRLLREMRLPVRLTRQYLLYFAGLPVSSFGLHTFPAFLVDNMYGFPIHSSDDSYGLNWLKVASHDFGMLVDPDETPRVEESVITRTAEKACNVLPELRQARLAHVDSCIYDVSPDEDFILDVVPYNPRIVFATGLSGHGFKFGPLLGELLSSLVCDTWPTVSLERFRLARFAPQSTRHALPFVSVGSTTEDRGLTARIDKGYRR
jgi:glycine/D-amino acid oxidase-like deaminating enzyme